MHQLAELAGLPIPSIPVFLAMGGLIGWEPFPSGRDVVIYCSCPNEATSARAALELKRFGITRVRPLEEGYDAWRQRGYPCRFASRFALILHIAYSRPGIRTNSRLNCRKFGEKNLKMRRSISPERGLRFRSRDRNKGLESQ
jgi:rhodanese-related sulfurtransferase